MTASATCWRRLGTGRISRMIKVVNGVDLYDHINEYDVILIGVDLYYRMANGIQLKVMLNHPHVFDRNLETKYADRDKLGSIIECKKESEPTFCLCFICDGNFRPDIQPEYVSYDALERCIRLVDKKYKGKKVACPLLGASRFDGNGDRDKCLSILKGNSNNIDLTVYDYYQKSRHEEVTEVYYREQAVKLEDRDKYYGMVKERKRLAEERFKKNGHRRY